MVRSAAVGPLAPNVMLHWPRLGELSCQRPARLTGGDPACDGCAAGDELDPGQSMPLQPPSASSTRIRADAWNARRVSFIALRLTFSAELRNRRLPWDRIAKPPA